MLLDKRDCISHSLMKINSARIHNRLRQIQEFASATRVGIYHPVGSEVMTQDIIQEMLSGGIDTYLPRTTGESMEFRKINGFEDLEPGRFDLMEPKERCKISVEMQTILIPAVGASANMYRLGYGRGFYDRYLKKANAVKIALCFQTQMVKSMPYDTHDVQMDYIVTEEQTYK